MMMYVVAVVVSVVVCAGILIAMAMRRYPRVKAALHIGRAGFYIEAEDRYKTTGRRRDSARLNG